MGAHFATSLLDGRMTKLLKIFFALAGLALIAMPAQAYEKGDWIIRGGAGMVDPESIALTDTVDDVRIVVDDSTSLVLSGTYMFSPNWGFDILAAWPFSHDISIGDAVGGSTLKFAETKHLPPTFSFQYHFAPEATFMPYAGLGLNYTTFFSEEIDQTVLPGISMSIDDSFGLAAQLGADIMLNDSWLLNIDIRYVNIEPDVTLSDGVDAETVGIEINPMVYSVSFGFVF